MRKIYLVSNNYSTKNKLIRWREISSLLEKKDESIILSKENVEKLTSVIDSEDFLCINGGDGTIQKVLDYFLKQEKKLPIIVPLNAGATNALARDTNIFGSPYSILKKIVYLRNEQFLIQTRYLMKITDYNSQKICYGFFAGFGIMPYLFKNRHGDFLTGRKTHLKVSKTIFSALQKKDVSYINKNMTLNYEGRIMNEDFFVLLFLTTAKPLPFMKPLFDNEKNHFYMIGTSVDPRTAGKQFMSLLLGQKLKKKDLFVKTLKEISISGKNLDFIVDGEQFLSNNESINNIKIELAQELIRIPSLKN